MKLEEYRKKRNFDKTPEPFGKMRSQSGSDRKLDFVLHKHDATRLHYDLRLELNGVLKSWAIPKGPSLNPSEKRLALETEDHPMQYLDFEGVIPKGSYGAGPVMVWDKGTYTIPTTDKAYISEDVLEKEYGNGKMEFELNGEKLKGNFALIKLKDAKEKNAWLFVKGKDKYVNKSYTLKDYSVLTGRSLESIRKDKTLLPVTDHDVAGIPEMKGAVKSEFLQNIEPMLATLIKEPFSKRDWLFEPKLDGYRALAYVNEGEVNLLSRQLNKIGSDYLPIRDEFEKLSFDAIFDGEIVVVDRRGRSDFQLLQNWKRNRKGKLLFFAFDILYYQGLDLRLVSLEKRKQLLERLLPDNSILKYTRHILRKGKRLFEKVMEKNMEGVIAKRADSIYESGKRSKNWLKIKNQKQMEAVVVGFTKPSGSRKYFGSLLLGVYIDRKLTYIGNAGTGFSDQDLKEVFTRLEKLKQNKSPFSYDIEVKEENVNWVEPKVVTEIRYKQLTDDKKLLHAVFLGIRDDIRAEEVVLEKLKNVKSVITEPVPPEKVKLSNPRKVFWPEQNYTKADMYNYYDKVGDFILPYLKDRPQVLFRNPDGIKGKGFFQKDVAGKVPDWIHTIKISSSSKDEQIEYLLCQNKQTLLYMANLGTIEINPWLSKIDRLDFPDFAVFDLDRDKADFEKVVFVANKLHDLFERIKVKSYPKTSGGSGMHIYVPTGAKYTYDQIVQFGKIVVMLIHKNLPKITSIERSPEKRRNKVYLDYLQNGRGKTMASVYSLRPKPKAPVSTPLEWKEVKKGLSPNNFTLNNAEERLKAKGDVWEGILEDEVDLLKALKLLSYFG